jgi:hypothetical protein
VTKRKLVAAFVLASSAPACTSSGIGSASSSDGGLGAGDATLGDDGGQRSNPVTVVTAAEKGACAADPTGCLTGTAATSRFTARPAQVRAELYPVFPYGTEPALEAQLIDDAGTWAFHGLDGGLDPWAHYYVQIVGDFHLPTDAGSFVAAVKGPLSIPSNGSPIAVDVPPVQLNVFESRAPGGPMQVRWALAHVFDPASGAEIRGGASVTLVVAGAPIAVPWSDVDAGGVGAYYTVFSQPPPAQPMYTMTVMAPELGPSALSFQLVAEEPAFDGSIVSPDGGASVPAHQPLTVTWTPEPQADYEVLQVLRSSGLASVYLSPRADSPAQTEETVDAGVDPGSYLLDLSYSKTRCAATADGCVQSNTVSEVNVTAQ